MVCCFIPQSLSSINRAYTDKRVLYWVKLLKPAPQIGTLPQAFSFLGVVAASTLHLLLIWKCCEQYNQHELQVKTPIIAPTLAWMQWDYIPMTCIYQHNSARYRDKKYGTGHSCIYALCACMHMLHAYIYRMYVHITTYWIRLHQYDYITIK